MATAHGVTGTVSFTSGYVANVKAWELTHEAETHDITDFTSSGPRAFLGGLTQWSGSYTCNYDSSTVAVAPGAAAAALVLTAMTGQTFGGTAILQSFSLSASVDGIPEITCSFQGTSTLSIA